MVQRTKELSGTFQFSPQHTKVEKREPQKEVASLVRKTCEKNF